jgi:hypothetical protein
MKFLDYNQFINENLWKGDKSDHSNSPFLKFPELTMTRKAGLKNKGDLNATGEMVHFIYKNPGLSAKEIKNLLLECPIDQPENITYYTGGHALQAPLKAALATPYVHRTTDRPAIYYAHPDPSLNIDQIKHELRGVLIGKKFGL